MGEVGFCKHLKLQKKNQITLNMLLHSVFQYFPNKYKCQDGKSVRGAVGRYVIYALPKSCLTSRICEKMCKMCK